MASHAQPLSADALPRAVGAQRGLRVCHIVSGDLWAGAEVQVATVASYLVERPDVNLSAVLLNEGRLASELRRLGVRGGRSRDTLVVRRPHHRGLEAHGGDPEGFRVRADAGDPYSQRSRPAQGTGDANRGRSEARAGYWPARTPRRHRGQALARQGASVLSPSRPANS